MKEETQESKLPVDLYPVDLHIEGKKYRIHSELDTEYLHKLASTLEKKIQETKKAHPRLKSLEIITLTAINLVDELMQEYKEAEKNREENIEKDQDIKRRSSQLIELLDFGMIGDHPEI